MTNKDFFDILGINGREDSYTDLIKYAFDTSMEFKKKFCEFFAGSFNEDFSLSVRKKFTDNNLKPNNRIPDMFLYSKQKAEIILIENKIFSGEGNGQLNRYSEPAFIAALKNEFKIDNDKVVKLYFVTLDGKAASCGNFIPTMWSTMIQNCTENIIFEDKRLSVLIEDLKTRSKHYADFKSPVSDTRYAAYFQLCTKWVNEQRAFECFFAEIKEWLEKEYELKSKFTWANNISGTQFLLVLYRPDWIGAEIDQEGLENTVLQDETYRNLHIELNWTPKNNKMSLSIHYETNPYKTKKELDIINGFNKEKVEKYVNCRDNFTDRIYKCVPSGWSKINKTNTIINKSFSLKLNPTHEDIKKWMSEEVGAACECIIKALPSNLIDIN